MKFNESYNFKSELSHSGLRKVRGGRMEMIKWTKRTNVKERKHLTLVEVIILQHGSGFFERFYMSDPVLLPEHAVSNLSVPTLPWSSY